MGDAVGPWRDKLDVTWERSGEYAGRLHIEFASPSYTCTLNGRIQADRQSIVGVATCEGPEQPFTARIVRP
jgi:hypothetical protein